MKVLRRRRQVADLDIVLRAGLEKPLEPRIGMLRTLTFVAVRQEEDNAARALPLRFGRDDELVDDGLRAVGEIAELRLPETEHVWIIERITVVESEHGGLGEQTVV